MPVSACSAGFAGDADNAGSAGGAGSADSAGFCGCISLDVLYVIPKWPKSLPINKRPAKEATHKKKKQNKQNTAKNTNTSKPKYGANTNANITHLHHTNTEKSEPKYSTNASNICQKLSQMELLGGLGDTTPKKLLILNYWLGHWLILAPFWEPQNALKSDKNRCWFLAHFL